MIYIYGDSHAGFLLKNLAQPSINLSQSSITMFRIGRDNSIINYNIEVDKSEHMIVLLYGEVDCRCHIGKQIHLGRQEDEIIEELIQKYITTIKNSIYKAKVIIVAVPPPTAQNDYESINGPITHEFPFIGSDEDRVRYTNKVNTLLKEYSHVNNFVFFDPFNIYKRQNGTLKYELSDNSVHIKDTSDFIHEFNTFYFNLQ